ncbi:MAG TPA: ABC transporter permease [Burkholderiaceae bacterium]|nr:ABC transporter permease [Burkholderiaceae bacterium]
MHIEARTTGRGRAYIAAPVAAVAASLVLCGVLLLASGAPLLTAYANLLLGALGSPAAVADTLTRATPLVFTGLAVAVAFRARLWNIGAEGQFYAGAIAAVLAAQHVVTWPLWLALPAIGFAGALAGGMLFLVAVALKYRLNVDEVVTTLLSNFIALLLVSLLIDGPLKDPLSMGWPQSIPVDDSLRLGVVLDGSQLTYAFALAGVIALIVWVYEARTVWGFESRVLGVNGMAARFAGMPVGRVTVRVALMSGGLAGVAGVCEVLGPRGFLVADMSPGYGYTGIVVATLAQLHPLGVFAAAIFVAAIYVGADAMSHTLSVSNYIAEVIVSVMLLTTLVSLFFTEYRIRRG